MRPRTWQRAVCAAAIAVTGAVCLPGAAQASLGITDCHGQDAPGYGVGPGCFDGLLSAGESGAAGFTQAGGHPYSASTSFALNTYANPAKGDPWSPQPLKDALVDVPAGLIGNPAAAPTCTLDQLFSKDSIGNPANDCPSASQVGFASTVAVALCFPGTCLALPIEQPLFNMDPPPGIPARFAFEVAGTLIVLDAQLRGDGDYGFTVASRDISAALPILGSTVTLWGVPADPSHDFQRQCLGQGNGETGCPAELENGDPAPQTAFLRLPTSCAGPQETVLHTDSWFDPGTYNPDGTPNLSDPAWKQASFLSHNPPGLSLQGEPFYELPLKESLGFPRGAGGCDQVPFEPQIQVRPTTDQADSPSGLEFDLSLPQDELTDPKAIAQSDLRKAVVRLPQGISVNASSLAGLGVCTLAQIDLHSRNTEPTCPDSSKIGTVSIDTPLLEEPIDGTVYLAAQTDNPFGSLIALYIVAEARGQIVKLSGQVEPTASGQLVTSFDNQPQVPFENLHLVLKSGPRAPLITPRSCGTHTASATLTPWSGNAAVDLTSSFQITKGPSGQPCPSGQFDPRFSAGAQSPLAATFSPFNLRLRREDGTRELTGLAATLPPGLSGRLAGIPYCPEAALGAVSEAQGTAAAQIASPSCPAASQVGAVTVGAGAGPDPFYVQTGKAYLAGPYKGAPLSLAIVTPALAGPFDLGSVLVRTALRVDPETAQITAVSDPLPTALHGIALDLRDVRVNVDRPGFTLNPSSCEPMSINATISGAEGASANRSQPFQVGNCAELGFKPKLKLSLKGKTNRAAHPSLKAVLTAKPGEANIARVQVTLPHSAFLDQAHIGTVCTRVQFAAHACPTASIYGHATAVTPLLDQPLSGPVYLRSSSHKLPDLVADLNGQIEVTLDGKVDTGKGGGIRNNFQVVPDAPVSKFVLTMNGGSRGLIQNSENLCSPQAKTHAIANFDGQNGKIHDTTPKVQNSCKSAKHKKGRKGHR